ncbi:MAG: aldo/keto reductase [Amycolatopsis sp.]|jgi:2,5-diketo-D-gluconate reductase A|uniref:aldo/keto reductase n=1 Tax=Amycolatopsis sp. TaxID=37632 RepID=UPI002613A5E3|nr:aldo/keto reductase [Amycolatopsis sp.]MCU1679288.1 aldo/keto reductase [Amycolatopsis sp.]
MTNIPNIELISGTTIPQLGFGVFQIPADDTAESVRTALDVGYRHIDTAQMYGNEVGVGVGIAKSGIAREDVFITTKLANDQHGYDNAVKALDGSLDRLGTSYVDLYLIHWPLAKKNLYVETWKAFEDLARSGKARAIGVSNFQPAHLEALVKAGTTTPAVNQIELHPALQQTELRAYHQDHGIITEAWSPLAQGEVLDEPALTEIAGKIGKTPAQVVLRWHLQHGNVIFPKSVTASRIEENRDIFDFELGGHEMAAIAGLDKGRRTGPDPDTFEG